jgi:hypothetical protein
MGTKTIQKRKKMAIAVLMFIVLLAIIFQGIKVGLRATYSVWTYDIENFHSAKESYSLIAENMIQVYEDEKNVNSNLKSVILWIALSNNWTIRCINDAASYNYYDIVIDIGPDLCEAYNLVSSCLMGGYHGESCSVTAEGDRVVFSSGGRSHYVVYMMNGGVPRGLSLGNNFEDNYYREWLTFKWYYIAR